MRWTSAFKGRNRRRKTKKEERLTAETLRAQSSERREELGRHTEFFVALAGSARLPWASSIEGAAAPLAPTRESSVLLALSKRLSASV
jgi:hypothetical protein